jgi:hypothetical protein
MSDVPMYGSMFLIGAALALASGVGLFLPSGYRLSIVLALLAGAGVGVAGLALGLSFLADTGAEDVVTSDDWWRLFFVSSIAGFATVASGMAVAWRRARSHGAA